MRENISKIIIENHTHIATAEKLNKQMPSFSFLLEEGNYALYSFLQFCCLERVIKCESEAGG